MPALVLGAGSTRPRRHRGQVRTGPVGVESDLLAESPVFMARGGPDPGLLPLLWHWVRARAGTAGTLRGVISFSA